MNKAFVIFLALAVAQASATEVLNCDNDGTDTTTVTISNCAKGPCTLVRGGTVAVTATFTPTVVVNELTVSVKATILFVRLGFPGVDGTNVCGKVVKTIDNSPAPCPLQPGVQYTYKDTLSISLFFPPISTTVTYGLLSGSDTLKCFRVAVSL